MSDSETSTSTSTSSSTSSSYEDSNSEVRLSKFKVGGYAPISVSELLNNRYRIVKKLGFGRFSIVYMVYDYEYKDFKAIKVTRSAETYAESSVDEIKILNKLNSKMCSTFNYDSIFGTHIVIVLDLLGENLYSVLKKYNNGLPHNTVKIIFKNLLDILVLAEFKNIVHTDIKPENILLKRIPKKLSNITKKYKVLDLDYELRLVDKNKIILTETERKKMRRNRSKPTYYPSSDSEDNTELENRLLTGVQLMDWGNGIILGEDTLSSSICTEPYRPPENLISKEYTTNADIWSVGCLIYELLTGEILFDSETYDEGGRDEKHDTHLASMLEITGGDPTVYKEGRYYNDYFREDGTMRFIRNLRNVSLSDILKIRHHFDIEDATKWSNVILYMLDFNRWTRPSAKQIYDKYKDFLNNI